VRFSGSRQDGDKLQQLRATLPTEVRVTSITHPLFGRLLRASGFKRRAGVLLLVVTLPDGTPGTMRADVTDILGGVSPEISTVVLSADGLSRLHRLALMLGVQERRRGTNARK
jgi:hypothetical protein